MSWNLRVLVTESPTIGGETTYEFAIHEVYYKNGIPNGSTIHCAKMNFEDEEGMRWYYEKMGEAINKPFLWGNDRFPEEFKK